MYKRKFSIIFTSIIVILIVLVPITAARAGKKPPPTPAPSPTPVPYPGPDDYQPKAQAYPPPETPEPTPPPLLPSGPDQPRPRVPYVWGYYFGHWWMSLDGFGFQADLTGIICVMRNGINPNCLPVYWTRYEAQYDRNWYYTDPAPFCGGIWSVYYAVLEGMVADVHEPNEYEMPCIYLPDIYKEFQT